MVLTNSTNNKQQKSHIGRKKKVNRQSRRKEPTPPVVASSPTKAATESLLLGTVDDIKELPTAVKSKRVEGAMLALLDKVFEDDSNGKVECAKALLQTVLFTEGISMHSNKSLPPLLTGMNPNQNVSERAIVEYNPDVFRVDKKGKERTQDAARQYKKRKIDALEGAVKSIGDAQQQLIVLHGYLKRNQNCEPVVQSALNSIAQGPDIATQLLKNVATVMNKTSANPYLHDVRAFRQTILMTMAPSVMPSNRAIKKGITATLGLKCSKGLSAMLKAAVIQKQRIMSSNLGSLPLIQYVPKKSRTCFTLEYILELHEWILHQCDLVVASPSSNHSILVKDPFSGEKTRQQKYYYISSIRELHNDLIKPAPDGFGGAWEGGKVVISDTILCNLLPKQLTRLTDSHKLMCGCEICIIAKEFVHTLVAFVGRLLKQLEDEIANDIEPLEKERDYLDLYDFMYGAAEEKEPLFKHPRDFISQMTCPLMNDLCPMKCALQRCNLCPSLDFPSVLLSENSVAKVITFQCYEYHSYCTLHKSLVGSPTECPGCVTAREQEPFPQTGKLIRKLQLTRKVAPIGTFIKQYFVPLMVKARYHYLHVALLSKNHCVSLRRDAFCSNENSVSTQRDYADALVAEFDSEIQSTHFGDNPKISMEGVTLRFHRLKDDTMHADGFHYHCYVADDKRQDARTTFVNQESLIRQLRQEKKLPETGSILYELLDGCSKQYRCANAFYLMSLLAYQYCITVDRMIQAPHHGKGNCDSQGGIDKNHLRRFFRRTATPKTNTRNKIAAHTVDENGKRSSMAVRMAEILSSEDRNSGCKGHSKHAKRERAASIQRRHYHVMHHGNTEADANAPLPLLNSSFEYSGYPSVKGETQNGMMSHYHFLAVPNLGVGKVASRRIPCACMCCRNTLSLVWDETIKHPIDQPMFKPTLDCIYRPILGNLNDWKIITVSPISGQVEPDEMQDIFDDVLLEREAAAARTIKVGSLGAYSAADSFYLVKWTTDPYALEQDSKNVEGLESDTVLLKGAIVVKGMYYNEVPRAPRWYTPPPTRRVNERVFRVRYVVEPTVDIDDNPVFSAYRGGGDRIRQMGGVRIKKECHDHIMAELARRARLDFEESPAANDSVGVINDHDEDDNSDEDDRE